MVTKDFTKVWWKAVWKSLIENISLLQTRLSFVHSEHDTPQADSLQPVLIYFKNPSFSTATALFNQLFKHTNIITMMLKGFICVSRDAGFIKFEHISSLHPIPQKRVRTRKVTSKMEMQLVI